MSTKTRARERFESEIQKPRETMLARARRAVGAEDAEDVVQSTLLAALRSKVWEQVGVPQNWILGVLHYELMQASKRKSVREMREKRIDEYAAWETLAADLAASGGDLVDRMAGDEETADKISLVMQAMDEAGLASKEDYVVLARLRGRTDAEIGEQLGIEPNAVRAYHSQACAKIRAAIAAKGGGQ